MNPAEWLARTAAAHGASPALFQGTCLTADYATFARHAAGIGASLTARGVQPGDRVAVYLSNAPEYLEILYGIWWAGAVAVPINAKLHPAEAAWIIGQSGAALVFSDAAHRTELGGQITALIIAVDHSDAFGAMRDTPGIGGPVAMMPTDIAWLFYTSGTTGRPKGVMISCGNIAAMVACYFIDVDTVSPFDAALYAAPMSHGAGLYNFMHVIRAARHVVPESGGFDAAEVLRLAPLVGPVSMFAAPTMVRRLVDVATGNGHDANTAPAGQGIRTIVYAGGPMYEADILDATRVMGARFVQIYGQGECPMGITALPRQDIVDRSHPQWRTRLNSVGRAQTLVEVAILDNSGQAVPDGEVGEITVRGATVMPGYWQNPGATSEALRDGWLWTGDMGRKDADGYVTLQDRSKDVVISGGSNVYPREVEDVLLSHDAVHEAAVVGRPDPEWGEIVVAYVVCHPGKSVAPDTLDALCLDRIARFKRPKLYRFVDALPKNNYGKVVKTTLRALLQNTAQEEDVPPKNGP